MAKIRRSVESDTYAEFKLILRQYFEVLFRIPVRMVPSWFQFFGRWLIIFLHTVLSTTPRSDNQVGIQQ